MISPIGLQLTPSLSPMPAAAPVAGDSVQLRSGLGSFPAQRAWPATLGGTQGGGAPVQELNRAAMAELFRSNATSAHELWRVKADGGNVKSPPAIGSDGTLYVVTDRGVTAIGEDGKQRWKTNLEGLQGYSTPLLDGEGNLHLSGEYGAPGYNVVSSGGAIIRQKDHGYAQVPPIHGPDDTLYFGNYDGIVRRLDKDGKELWKYDIGSHVNGEMAVARDGSVYAVGDPGTLWAIKPDGTLKWKKFEDGFSERVQTGAGVRVTPDDEILAVAWNSSLRCMDADGNVKWEYGAFEQKRFDELSPDEREEAEQHGNTGLGSTPVLSRDGKTIYVGGMDGTLHALTRDGHKIWTCETGDDMGDHGVQVGDDGTLYTSSEHEAKLHAVSPDGQVMWSYESDNQSNYAYISTRGDSVYLVTHEGQVTALSGKALQARVEEAMQKPDGPPPTIEVGDGHIVINGVRVPKRR